MGISKKLCLLIALVLGSGLLPPERVAHALPVDTSVELTTIAFGSCNMQRAGRDHWPSIVAQKPQLWIWGGDNIYADRLWPSARQGEYNHLKSAPEYKALVDTAMIVGTWDDHDYGYNNVGKNYEGKKDSQKLLLDFLDEPPNSPRRQQEGVYASYDFGPEGRRVKVILLDLRYFRDDPAPGADMLGRAQWKWLEKEILTDEAEVTLLVSSSQLIPNEHNGERWDEYPKNRKRLLALLDSFLESGKQRFIVLSGDRHLAEFSRLPMSKGRELWEVTSSGLTHSSKSTNSPNRFREGPLYLNRNFGIVRIDWEQTPPAVSVEVRSYDNKLVHSETIKE